MKKESTHKCGIVDSLNLAWTNSMIEILWAKQPKSCLKEVDAFIKKERFPLSVSTASCDVKHTFTSRTRYL